MSQSRDIYVYLRGSERVCVDPFRAQRLLHAALGGSLKQAITDANNAELPAAAWSEAIEKLVAATRYAFDLPAFNPKTGEGCTEQECREVLHGYLVWLQKKRMKSGSTPT